MKLEFPKGFLWGSATASYQVEGGIENNDWAEAARKGKVPLCGEACDHYNLYEKDLDIAKSLSQNCHKISIEWSRIEPEEGKFDAKEVEHYRNVLNAMERRGFMRFVGIWHFTLPDWFVKKGGFLHPDAPATFARYASFITHELGDKISFLITINEPMVYASNGFFRGNWPPFEKNLITFFRITNALIHAHRAAFKAIKSEFPTLPVGIAKNNIYFHTNGGNPFHLFAAFIMKWFWNHRFLKKIAAFQDFIGINYYFHREWGSQKTYEKTDFNWDIYPEGLFHILSEVKQYNKPVYVIENGLADEKDKDRANFIENHIRSVHKAIKNGVDMRGYLYWSLLDNYEWAEGFNKRFGLVEIDYANQSRNIRPSAYIFKEICELNAVREA
jgi:beta-glucosidase